MATSTFTNTNKRASSSAQSSLLAVTRVHVKRKGKKNADVKCIHIKMKQIKIMGKL